MGDPRYTLVDIHAVNQQGATAMNLKDNDFMRKKVDDIVASWSGGQAVNPSAQPNTRPNNNINVPDNQVRTNNALSFSIPNGWQTYMRPSQDMPILTAQVMAPDQVTTVSVFDVPVSNAQQALATINQYFYNFGMEMQYQANGNGLAGQTYSANGTFNWVGKTLKTQNGIRFVAVGTPDYLFSQNSGIINQVYNSIR